MLDSLIHMEALPGRHLLIWRPFLITIVIFAAAFICVLSPTHGVLRTLTRSILLVCHGFLQVFDAVVMSCILVSSVTLAMEEPGSSEEHTMIFAELDIVFMIVFTVEAPVLIE